MIELQGLSKTYRSLFGTRVVPALDDLTLTLARGEVVGVAGPNGAGKSTLISLLLGYLRPTQGQVQVDRMPPRRWVERHGVGYQAELVAIPGRWSVEGALQRYTVLSGVPRAQLNQRVDALLSDFGLAEQRRKRVRELSKGNLQRLGLAQALAGDSDLVVLDEPTHGLDPLWTQRFRDVVQVLAVVHVDVQRELRIEGKGPEELPEQVAALVLENAADHLGPVIQARIGCDREE